jgi:hypothetical protein
VTRMALGDAVPWQGPALSEVIANLLQPQPDRAVGLVRHCQATWRGQVPGQFGQNARPVSVSFPAPEVPIRSCPTISLRTQHLEDKRPAQRGGTVAADAVEAIDAKPLTSASVDGGH